MKIDGLAAIVTGGASGLGGATARMLADRGARVTIFDLNPELGEQHAAAIGGRFLSVNVADDESVAAAVADAGGLVAGGVLYLGCGKRRHVRRGMGVPEPARRLAHGFDREDGRLVSADDYLVRASEFCAAAEGA